MAASNWNAQLGPHREEGDDWFTVENQKLASLYGEGFLRTYTTNQGIIVYFCGLCSCEMNGKPSLKSHCDGMKHLRKKKLFDNGELQVSESPRESSFGEITNNVCVIRRPGQEGSNRSRKRPSSQDSYGAPSKRPPPHIDPGPSSSGNTRLSTSNTGSILHKLGSCCIKSNEDADLALNVMETLTRTLIEYGKRKQEAKAVEILIDAQFKISSVRALQDKKD